MHLIYNGQVPQYLSDCVFTVSAASHRYRLRSSGSAGYVLRRTRTRFGEHGFFYSGPAAWNARPSDLLRQRLKSVLFDRAYHWLLLAPLDVSYSGVLQIACWLIDWLIDWPLTALRNATSSWFSVTVQQDELSPVHSDTHAQGAFCDLQNTPKGVSDYELRRVPMGV